MSPDDELIAGWLIDWDEAREAGREPTPEELARDRPDLVPRLAEAIRRLRATQWMCEDTGEGIAVAAPRHRPGDILSYRYRLDRVIGEGGFGHVWSGHDQRLDRPVAVKLPRRRRPSAGVDPLLAEARTAANLCHPGIVQVFDVRPDGTTFYIVSELVDGETLASCLNVGRPTVAEAILIAREIAGVLAFAHARRFIHRDLKPSNILIDRDRDRLRLTDFGISLTFDEAAGGTAGACGTPAYMAPEQIRGDPFDGRADVYSLGVILYELLTCRRPFEGANPRELREAILRGNPPYVEQLNPNVTWRLGRTVRLCMACNPNDRFSNVDEVCAELDASAKAGRPDALLSALARIQGWLSSRRSRRGRIDRVFPPTPDPAPKRPRWWLRPAGVTLVLAGAIGLMTVAAQNSSLEQRLFALCAACIVAGVAAVRERHRLVAFLVIVTVGATCGFCVSGLVTGLFRNFLAGIGWP